MKAMILAAGRGERLRPLTDELPKPLISVGGRALIEHHLLALRDLGVDEVVINVAYRAGQLRDFLGDGGRYGLMLHYSDESSCLLGTGGGIVKALPLLGDAPFLLLSADIWLASLALPRDLPSNKRGCLLMVENRPEHTAGDYAMTPEGCLTMGKPRLTYAGVGLLDPILFSGMPLAPFELSAVFKRAIADGQLMGQMLKGNWFNVGTPAVLASVREALAPGA